MSLDQCHSTVGEQSVLKPRAATHEEVGVTGKKYWRGLEDASDAPEFRDWLEKELPTDASRLLESSRRTFLKLMGASVALAGAATLPGCRRPDHKIYSYSKTVPEDIVPGKAQFYATSVQLPGGAVEGILCESHEGRPTKIEGNPLHAGNNGKSSAFAQASLLNLYDPDRLKDPRFTGRSKEEAEVARSWDDFAAWTKQNFAKYKASKGAGLAFVVNKTRSVSRDAAKAKIKSVYPQAMWVAYDPIESAEPIKGSMLAFGKPMRESLHADKADVIVSLDRDFMYDDAGSLRNMRGFTSRRSPMKTADTMNRLYMLESSFSVTGAKADHRKALAPSMISIAAVELAKAIASQKGVEVGGAIASALSRFSVPAGAAMSAALEKFIAECAKDVASRGPGKSLIVAGPTQPAAVHALVAALNVALGNVGATVSYRAMGEDEAADGLAGLKSLSAALEAGSVDALVCINTNPAYDAPADLKFAERMGNTTHRIALAFEHNETVERSTWHLPLAHALESWGDLESVDGVQSPVQPMIAPLYGSKSEIEVLAIIAGDDLDAAHGHEIVRQAWKNRADFVKSKGGGDFEKAWRRALNDGVFGQTAAADPGKPKLEAIASALDAMKITPPGEDRLDVAFVMGHTGDGSFNNNAWMQELPDPLSKVVWDNVAFVNAATAKRFGLEQEKETKEVRHARMMRVSVGGQSVSAAAWVTPGIPDNTVVLMYGYGREHVGTVGKGTGHNVFPIAGVGGSNRRMAQGATLARVTEGDRWYPISTTQSHGSMEGRALVREVDLPAWQAFGDDPFKDLNEEMKKKLLVDSYKQPRDLNFAERMGELAHTPANVNAYINPQRGSKLEGEAVGSQKEHGSTAYRMDGKDRPVDFAKGPQWGMSIDLSSCTGCSACTIACQAENNIPVVGKIETNKGREMHWIRVDRYFSGDTSGGVDDNGVMFQPVACVHCENAPCETVCPVNATVHGPSGINYMVYNRCIGTRYCANNCPYKVRRFNFFDYGVKKLNGDFVGKQTLEDVGIGGPANVNLIPPRLRERLDEITKLSKNPNVTIRSRGVMEKCTYCIQRTNEARIEVKLNNLEMIPDGFFQTACQQACPADAIVFGDILDTKTSYPLPGGKTRSGSRVHEMREHQRSYLLLGFLNTRPRTTYMLAVRNPNLALIADDKERMERLKNPFHHGSHEGGHEGGGQGGQGGHGGAGHAAAGNQFDPTKTLTDRGYKLSLAVLGA